MFLSGEVGPVMSVSTEKGSERKRGDLGRRESKKIMQHCSSISAQAGGSEEFQFPATPLQVFQALSGSPSHRKI